MEDCTYDCVKNAQTLNTLDTPGFAQDIQVVENIAYVADGGSGLRAIGSP